MPADARWAAAAPRGSFERDALVSAAARILPLRFGFVECCFRGMTVTVIFIPRLPQN